MIMARHIEQERKFIGGLCSSLQADELFFPLNQPLFFQRPHNFPRMSRGNAAEQGQRLRLDAGFRIAESAIRQSLAKPSFRPVEFSFAEQVFEIERAAQLQAFFNHSSSPLSFFNFRDGAKNRVSLSGDDRVAQSLQTRHPIFHAFRHPGYVRFYPPISSVQPMGKPISHSTQPGFSEPPATTFS
jgi:hypothetical protein